MDLERAIETQRDALLRLLARLLIAVDVMSCRPFAGRVPRWIYRVASSVLHRAETAAAYLVVASARLHTSSDWSDASEARFVTYSSGSTVVERAVDSQPLSRDGAVCTSALRARIRALQARLNALPRHARQLVKRARSVDCGGQVQRHDNFAWRASDDLFGIVSTARRVACPRIERPPDTRLALNMIGANSLPHAGREVLADGR